MSNPLENMTPDDIGPIVAAALKWNGPAIFEAMREALTDANFHTAAAALMVTWNQPHLSKAAPAMLAALEQLTEAATHHQADAPAAIQAARAAINQAKGE